MTMRIWALAVALSFGLGSCAVAKAAVGDQPAAALSYPLHRNVTATLFWCGETAGPDPALVSHTSSAWEPDWVGGFGGVDDPGNRTGWFPAGFIPTESPFYVSLPYDDLDAQGQRKPSAAGIPWAEAGVPAGQSIVKNRWVRVSAGARVVYAQWEDAGPFGDDDFGSVFGTGSPEGQLDPPAGIGLSPALEQGLGLTGPSPVDWQFVDDRDVPPGPWFVVVTTTGVRR
jgi:hypothetical protein